MGRKRVTFSATDLTLEGVLYEQGGQVPGPGVVVCHPHPQYGGDMYNNVVVEVCRELESQGLTCLRFNFRGVGDSAGSFAQGVGEQDDLQGALSFLRTLKEVDDDRLGVVGYSFGAGVAARVAVVEPLVKAFVAVSLPSSMMEIALLQDCAKPKLFVSGNFDRFIPADDLERMVAGLPEPKGCLIVEGADHFWLDGLETAAAETARFLSNAL